jgi:hypothetical protein
MNKHTHCEPNPRFASARSEGSVFFSIIATAPEPPMKAISLRSDSFCGD